MTTIPIEVQVSTEQLLRAVEQLPAQELAAFVAQILTLQARREAPHLSQSETVLLLEINRGISVDLQQRFKELVAKRQSETITSDELIQITDQIEQRDAQRLAALDELAHLRRMTLPELMDTLGIQPPAYA